MYQSNYGSFPSNPKLEMSNEGGSENKAIEILKSVADCKSHSIMFHDNMSKECHMWGLQGMKRLHRYKALLDFIDLNLLLHYCIDIFGVNIKPDFVDDIKSVNNIEEYLNYYREEEIDMRSKLGKLAYELSEMGYVEEHKMICCYIPCITKQIEKANRWLQDFGKADWDWAYIRVVDAKLHDKVKEKEEKYGY